jgi:hypothetical protein
MMDYLTGGLLIVAPWLFGFADGSAAQWVPVVLGVGIIGVSLLTSRPPGTEARVYFGRGYDLSLSRIIPMRAHLVMDGLGGALLAVSPWLFGFADRTYLPHLVIGIAEIGLSLVTRTQPDTTQIVGRS